MKQKSSSTNTQQSENHAIIKFLKKITAPFYTLIDPEEQRKAYLISSLLLLLNVVVIAFTLVDLYVFAITQRASDVIFIIMDLILCIVFFLFYIISRTKYFKYVGALLILSLYASVGAEIIIEQDPIALIFWIGLFLIFNTILASFLFSTHKLALLSIGNIIFLIFISLTTLPEPLYFPYSIATLFFGALISFLMFFDNYYHNSRLKDLQNLNKEIKLAKNHAEKSKEELIQAMTELKQSNAELEQFAFSLSHDLKQPMYTLSGFSKLLSKHYSGKLDQKLDNYIDRINSIVNQMDTQITGLLEYSRVGRQETQFTETHLTMVLGTVMENLKVVIEERDAIITHDALPIIHADQSQIVRLFQNLIDNAIKFCEDKSPKIHIGVKKADNNRGWLFSVSDNGIGFDPQHVPRLFQIFQRLHGKDEYPGTGIGLATCKRIVERHGGRIWAKSEIGKGSTFYFTIQTEKKS
ncbi:MAG: ATP-binding protein [Candidatus Hodarchaeota archaeon]